MYIKEDQSNYHRNINRNLKKEFSKVLGHSLTLGATIHHIDPYVQENDILNCCCIDTNTQDANVIHLLISFCQRYNLTSIPQLVKKLDEVPIYQMELFQGDWIAENYSFSQLIKMIN